MGRFEGRRKKRGEGGGFGVSFFDSRCLVRVSARVSRPFIFGSLDLIFILSAKEETGIESRKGGR